MAWTVTKWLLAAGAVGVAAIAALIGALALRRFLKWRRLRKTAPRFAVVLAHGLMGFDELMVGGASLHYFRRVSGHLSKMGIAVYRPRVAGSASIAARAETLAEQLRALPARKVNLIAHSMGGLDARYAIAKLGLADRVASLTTLGTPHRGTPLADLGTRAAAVPLAVLRQLIEIEAFWDLTSRSMEGFNREVPDVPGVGYGCVLARCRPPLMNPLLIPTYRYLKKLAGENDGVVPIESQRWGTVLRDIEADHWAQIGWSIGFDTTRLFQEIAQQLRAMGY